MLEQILTDLPTADPQWNVILLRYFNPIGAHKSGLIGEDPKGIPNNLLPYVAPGSDWQTALSGVFETTMKHRTAPAFGIISTLDLAVGHVKALKKFNDTPDVRVYNLGTGERLRVLQVVHAFEKTCGHRSITK